MAKISASIGNELYKIKIVSPSGNVIIADEPETSGGKDLGFSPKELLASALAACTAATLRMYANHKQWDLQEVKMDTELERDDVANKTLIHRKLEFIGNLNEEQKTRLMEIANACPVHKILSNPIEINTTRV
jgi:putative redox protein